MKSLAPNTMIQNRYLIVQLIGKGGMGEVYLAVDQRLGSAVALKRTFFASDEMLGNAFEREAKTLARLRHPVLPKVSDHFTEGEEQYLVMEHIAGDDLSKRLEAAHKPFPVSWVLFWADQLLDALSYLHSHEPPIIHRDIKPQNLKLTDENHIVLLDFGLSKNSTGQTNITSSSSATSGSVVGYTPHYAPMEQIRGTGTNPRSDLNAHSATLYQLTTNSVPMDALTRADALLNEKPDPIRPLTELNPEIAPDISTVILKGMEVSQEKRWPNARDMQKALRKAYSQVQSAMSAHTVAFNAQTDLPPGAAEHYSKSAPPAEALDRELGKDSELPTRINSTPGIQSQPMPGNGSNFETSVTGQTPIDSTPRQADIKTEVFIAGNSPFPLVPDEPLPSESEPNFPSYRSQPEERPRIQENFADTTDYGSAPGHVGDATVPNVSYDQSYGGGTPEIASPEFFTTPNVNYGNQETPAYSPSDYNSEPRNDHQQQPTAASAAVGAVSSIPRQQAAPKKKSKVLLIVGVLSVLFILGLGAAGAGWFVYENYYASAAPEPSPSPEPTFEPSPTPEPTQESVFSTNTVDNANSNTGNVNLATPTPGPTVEVVTPERPRDETPNTPERPRPTPQATKSVQIRPSSTPSAKPTQKKSDNDRTKILQ
ncbi:MAG TPA: serine/threonine-protein kinase [Pyrinomonadaceae bacterium]|nr:serine/threonine-protein kinase [Pyrinomonadaceae bacterium]